MWTRQFAWLSTAPEIEHSGKGPKPEPVSRLKTMTEAGQAILWPPNPAPHITDWLFEIGPTASGAMGESPIGWQDMAAWSSMSGIELDAWEARTIKRLSTAYLAQRHRSEKRDCAAPYTGAADVATARSRVEAQFKGMFSALRGRD